MSPIIYTIHGSTLALQIAHLIEQVSMLLDCALLREPLLVLRKICHVIAMLASLVAFVLLRAKLIAGGSHTDICIPNLLLYPILDVLSHSTDASRGDS